MATIHLTKEQFIKRIADYEKNPGGFEFLGERPALIDFYADWCGPCKMLAPVLETVSDKFAGKVDIYKVNVDQEETLAKQFRTYTIPTLVVMKNGVITQQVVGARSKAQILELLS